MVEDCHVATLLAKTGTGAPRRHCEWAEGPAAIFTTGNDPQRTYFNFQWSKIATSLRPSQRPERQHNVVIASGPKAPRQSSQRGMIRNERILIFNGRRLPRRYAPRKDGSGSTSSSLRVG